MRDKQSKFQAPIEMDLPLPYGGADYTSASETDFNFCSSSTNMWLSPNGDLETRPSITPVFKGSGRVVGLFYSALFDCILVAFNSLRNPDGTWTDGVSNNLYKWDNTQDPPELEFIGTLSGTNNKVKMLEFLSNVFIASGGTLQYWDGTTFGNYSPHPGSIATPEMDFIDTWQERLWGFKGSHLYASGYRDPGDFGFGTTGTITTTTGGQMEIRPNDGSEISGLCIFQGNIYVTKASVKNNRASFWIITGSSFNAQSSDPFTVRLVTDGLGCYNPFTMLPTGNTVLFAGDDGLIYSETQLQDTLLPQSTPMNLRVAQAFKGNNEAHMAAYQPRLGYYFLIMNNEVTQYTEIWCFHIGTKGWWRWELLNGHPTFMAPGQKNEFYIGDSDGVVSLLSDAVYGTDGGNNITRREQYTSGIAFGIIDSNSTRDKFFEWLFVDYLPLGEAGQMWVDYREGRGYTYAYTSSVLSADSQLNKQTIGWDFAVSQWDVPRVGWDSGGTVEVMNRINRRTNTLQIALNSNTPFRLIGVAITGGTIANKFRSWYRK